MFLWCSLAWQTEQASTQPLDKKKQKLKLLPEKKKVQKGTFTPEVRPAKLRYPDENLSLTKAAQMQQHQKQEV